MSFMMTYIDLDLKIPEGDTREKINTAEAARVGKMLAVAITAQEMPRRLGGEASPEELANDKSMNRRIAHVASQLMVGWGTNGNGASADVKREAASVDWKKWIAAHETFIVNRCRYIATWQHKVGDKTSERWAKGAVTRLENELKWLRYAMRDG